MKSRLDDFRMLIYLGKLVWCITLRSDIIGVSPEDQKPGPHACFAQWSLLEKTSLGKLGFSVSQWITGRPIRLLCVPINILSFSWSLSSLGQKVKGLSSVSISAWFWAKQLLCNHPSCHSRAGAPASFRICLTFTSITQLLFRRDKTGSPYPPPPPHTVRPVHPTNLLRDALLWSSPADGVVIAWSS